MVRVAPAAALALVLSLCCDVQAGPPTDTLDGVFMAVNHLLDDPELRERPARLLTAIRSVVGDRFDVREASRLAFGREWHAQTSTERDELVRLFGELLEHAYVLRIASRANVHRGLAIRYLGESIDGDRAAVTTTIGCRDGSEIPLEYRMIQHGQRWAIYDVSIDGVSLVANYRAQFHRIIQQSSYAELIARLKTTSPRTPTVSAAAGEVPLGARATEHASRDEVSPTAVLERDVAGDRDDHVTELIRPRPPELQARVPPASAAPVSATSYWIQLGAFTRPDAGEIASRLLEQSLPVSMDRVAIPTSHRGQLLLRVRVGPFSDHAEAVSKLRDLQTNGYQAFIAREPD